MYESELVEKFEPYLDPTTLGLDLPWEERGLVLDAPPEAVEQYKQFQKIMEDAKKRGIEL